MDLVSVRTLLNGFSQAAARFDEARTSEDPEPIFHAIFEALNWAVVFEDRVRTHWVPEGQPLDWEWRAWISDAEILEAVRWTRNTVHHDWVDALALDASGAEYPRTYPRVYHEWRWKRIEELPESGRAESREAYVELLDGVKVRDTLVTLGEVLSKVTMIMDPRRPKVYGVT